MRKIFYSLMTLALFAACSNNDALVTDLLTDQPIVVNAGVAELVSRAGVTDNDLTALSLTVHNAASALYSYDRVRYEKRGNSFVPAEGEVAPLWQNSRQEVTVSAWAPYIEGDLSSGYAFVVPADQSSNEASVASDFVWAKQVVNPEVGTAATDLIQYDNSQLKIALQHVMSKLVVSVQLATEMDDLANPVASVVVKGLENGCVLDLSDFTIQAPTNSVKKDIVAHAEPAKVGYDATFEAIFPPQHTQFGILIELSDGRKFLYDGEFDFQSDYAYALNLHVGKDKVVLAEGEAGITATSWGSDSDTGEDFESE